jgi:hypothetical protein
MEGYGEIKGEKVRRSEGHIQGKGGVIDVKPKKIRLFSKKT